MKNLHIRVQTRRENVHNTVRQRDDFRSAYGGYASHMSLGRCSHVCWKVFSNKIAAMGNRCETVEVALLIGED